MSVVCLCDTSMHLMELRLLCILDHAFIPNNVIAVNLESNKHTILYLSGGSYMLDIYSRNLLN